MITFKNVSFSYGEAPLLQNASLSLPSRGAVCFTAPSGSGKTTLLRLMAGLEQPQRGTVETGGASIAVLFQDNRLFPWLTVAENVALACRGKNPAPYLEAVELTADKDKYPAQLSGGMQRRAALARALAFEGDVLLLDEPFTGLDSELRERIAKAITTQFCPKLVVLITHTPEDAVLLSARVVPLTFPLCGTVEL